METPVFKSTLNTRAVLDGSLRYIRSDVPTAVTAEEAEWLLSNGITTVIDLRSDCEREKKPCPLMADARFSYRCLPITGGDRVPACPQDVPVSYIGMADERLDEILSLLLGAKTGVLYFCNAGKDRTGVVTAALLHRLGVGREAIVADYMKSKDNLSAVLTAYAAQNPAVDIEVITPHREYIEKFLDWYCAQ